MKTYSYGAKSFATCAVTIFLSLLSVSARATDIWWNGSVSTDLATDANWDGGTRPTAASDTMGFKAVPSADYTLTLANDLTFAGTWKFANGAQRHTFDLGGHTLTFQKAYSDSNHINVTNVIKNGSVAFVNGTTPLEVKFWHANSGSHLIVDEGGSFVGNLVFADAGTKYLTLRNGAQMRGAVHSRGANARVVIEGEGTALDANKNEFQIGGTGARAKGYILDGAVVANVSKLGLSSAVDYCAGNEAYLCVSNATLTMCKNASGNARFLLGSRKGANNSHCHRMDVIGGSQVVVYGDPNQCAVGNGDSHSNLLFVAGEGTTFTNMSAYNADQLLISGQSGNYNQIHVTSNAFLYSQSISAGGQAKNFGDSCVTSMCNRITVDSGATIECTQLYVAARHSDDQAKAQYLTSLICSNTVEVLAGGAINASGAVVCGTLKPSFAGGIVVRGQNASLSCGSLVLGAGGSYGNHVEVTEGGVLSLIKDLTIGVGSSNNWARLDGCSLNNNSYVITLGSAGNPGNCLWVGSGSSVAYNTMNIGGVGSETIVSNATFTLQKLRVATGADVQQNGGTKFSFFGENAKLSLTGGELFNFTNQCKFAFHVPKGGYASAPVQSLNASICLRDDVTFDFDFSKLKGAGVTTTLFSYTGNNATGSRIVASQAVLARLQTAASQQIPGSTVTLSADEKKIELSVPEEKIRNGLILLIR